MTLQFARDVYQRGASPARSLALHSPTTDTTLVACPPDCTVLVDASEHLQHARQRALSSSPSSLRPALGAARLRSPILSAYAVSVCPGAGLRWNGVAPIQCSCSCHFGDSDCDLLPGASRLYNHCDGTPA